MEPKPFLIQPGSLTLPGANSTVRSGAKTDYSVVNCSNSQKSSCPKNWNPKKSKPMSARRVDYSKPLKNAATKSTNSRLNPKPLAKHIEIKDLPDKDRFQRLRSEKKHFIDTIKLIAYRAETALAQLAREKIKRL